MDVKLLTWLRKALIDQAFIGDDGIEDNVGDSDEDEDNVTGDDDQGLVDNNPSKSSSSLEL